MMIMMAHQSPGPTLSCSFLMLLTLSSWEANGLTGPQLPHPQAIRTSALAAAAKKGPRFTQTAHNNKSDHKKKASSIEDLEKRLAEKWGTDLQRWTAQDHELEDDDNENDFEIIDNTKDASAFRARPVKDPWQAQEPKWDPSDHFDISLEKARRNQEKIQRKRSENNKPTTTVPDTTTTIDAQPSFFLRPPESRKKEPAKDEIEKRNGQPSLKRKQQDGIPLLNKNGSPQFCTLQQAEINFQDAVLLTQDTENVDSFVGTEEEPTTSSWSDIGVLPTLQENLLSMQCQQPLPVQVHTIQHATEGRDVLVGTYTGSGKTVAFLVPIIQRLLTGGTGDGSVRAIVVAPGRELASQIVSVARTLLEGTDVSVMLSIGGTTFARNLEQIRKRKPTILVGTPGRLAELVVGRPGEKRGRLKIHDVQSFVLDEFDALFEYKPHRDPTQAVVQKLSKQAGDDLQSFLCSATASDLLTSPKLKHFLRDDYGQVMTDRNDSTVTQVLDRTVSRPNVRVSRTVIHGVVHVPHRRFALSTLKTILHTDPLPQQILIFAESPRKVDVVVDKLGEMGIIAAGLHGGSQSDKMDRAEVSKALREGYVGIVVATELAARGLDAPLLTHVINLDLPTDSSHYAHRAGRCGRGGRPGVVINMTTNPKERRVPHKFADKLGIDMYTVDPRNGKLNIIEEDSIELDSI